MEQRRNCLDLLEEGILKSGTNQIIFYLVNIQLYLFFLYPDFLGGKLAFL